MYKCREVNSNQRENIANLGNLLTQRSRELRQEKQKKERKKKYFSEIIRRKDEKIKRLKNGKQNQLPGVGWTTNGYIEKYLQNNSIN